MKNTTSPTNISQKGFAMLYTVLLVTLILSIAIGISNITLKQAILSNLAKDSSIAFYQADAAVECGLYEDTLSPKLVPLGASTGAPFICGTISMRVNPDPSVTYQDHVQYDSFNVGAALPCFSITFDKTNASYSRVEGGGYNICGASTRQVERTLEVKY